MTGEIPEARTVGAPRSAALGPSSDEPNPIERTSARWIAAACFIFLGLQLLSLQLVALLLLFRGPVEVDALFGDVETASSWTPWLVGLALTIPYLPGAVFVGRSSHGRPVRECLFAAALIFVWEGLVAGVAYFLTQGSFVGVDGTAAGLRRIVVDEGLPLRIWPWTATGLLLAVAGGWLGDAVKLEASGGARGGEERTP